MDDISKSGRNWFECVINDSEENVEDELFCKNVSIEEVSIDKSSKTKD